MMALDWTPALVQAVGFKLLGDVLKYVRQGALDGPTYRLFADMIVHASDEPIPPEHTQWRIWRQLMIRFHLFEVTDIKAWVALIARFDSRGIRPPICLQRIPYTGLMATGWELPHPDMLIWIWHAARHDSSTCLTSRPHAEFTPPDDFQSLICTLRANSVDTADVGAEFTCLGREFGLPPNFEAISTPTKIRILHGRKIEPTRILKFQDLWGEKEYHSRLRGFFTPRGFRSAELSQLLHFRTFRPGWLNFPGHVYFTELRIIYGPDFSRKSTCPKSPVKRHFPNTILNLFHKIGPSDRGFFVSDVSLSGFAFRAPRPPSRERLPGAFRSQIGFRLP